MSYLHQIVRDARPRGRAASLPGPAPGASVAPAEPEPLVFTALSPSQHAADAALAAIPGSGAPGPAAPATPEPESVAMIAARPTAAAAVSTGTRKASAPVPASAQPTFPSPPAPGRQHLATKNALSGFGDAAAVEVGSPTRAAAPEMAAEPSEAWIAGPGARPGATAFQNPAARPAHADDPAASPARTSGVDQPGARAPGAEPSAATPATSDPAPAVGFAQSFDPAAAPAPAEVRIGAVEVVVEDRAPKPAPVARPSRAPISASRYHLRRI